MTASHSKSQRVYRLVRRAIQSGRFLPGQRIDPATLADELATSDMPARLALYRLVGKGLLDHHVRGGMYLPLPTEIALRDRYDWMRRLLDMACDIGPAPFRLETRQIEIGHDDVIKQTWQVFDAIARATGHASLHDELKRCNDWLAPIRRAKHHLIDDTFGELVRLNRHWQQRDLPRLKRALRDYHERRTALVPCIVATLKEQAERLG
ncbi:GntR family transcriptional regulator [Luteimonas abyssi]|uniref:GntR family transcriptional regulator n=1 Tax=Luteimonas abyssi TaxID=1247514 RepID=UPI000737C48C|nr:GntR family transcriptional regulator [Luteimonas abyssi]